MTDMLAFLKREVGLSLLSINIYYKISYISEEVNFIFIFGRIFWSNILWYILKMKPLLSWQEYFINIASKAIHTDILINGGIFIYWSSSALRRKG